MYSVNFSTSLTPPVAFYFLHQLVSVKAFEQELQAVSLPFLLGFALWWNMTQGSQKTEGKPAVSASPASTGSWFFFQDWVPGFLLFPSLLCTALCLSSKSYFSSWCGGAWHTLLRQAMKSVLISSHQWKGSVRWEWADRLPKSAGPGLEYWCIANYNSFFFFLNKLFILFF